MTLTINLLPEETQRLAADAHQRGLSLEEYVYRRLYAEPRPRTHDITELRGLGKELWEGVDVRAYLDELRGDEDTGK